MKDSQLSRILGAGVLSAYDKFEELLNCEYAGVVERQRLYAVRQFCDFLMNGRPPRQGQGNIPTRDELMSSIWKGGNNG